MSTLAFLKDTPGLADSHVKKPVVVTVPPGGNATAIAKNIESLHPDTKVTVEGNHLSILLPPEIKVGTEPVDLKKLAFTLKAMNDAKALGLTADGCCGHQLGCCVNLL